MHVLAVGVNRHQQGEILDFELPYGFRRTKLLVIIYVKDFYNGFREHLGASACGAKIHGAILTERFRSFRGKPTLPYESLHAISSDNIGNIRRSTVGSCRSGSGDPPSIAFLDNDRAAMINYRAFQVDRQSGRSLGFKKEFVQRIPSGIDDSRQQDSISGTELIDIL